MGYDYVIKYLKEEFKFTDISHFDKAPPLSCIYKQEIIFHKQPITVCLNNLSEYKINLKIKTLNGNKLIVLTKDFNPISQYFLILIISLSFIIVIISALFYSFYAQFLSLSIEPFTNLYKSLLEKKCAVDSPYIEIQEIGKSITDNFEKERQIDRLKAIAETIQMVAHDVRKPLNMTSVFINRLKALNHTELATYADKNLPIIGKATEDAEEIIQDLLDINHDRPAQLQTVNLKIFLTEMMGVYYSKIPIEIFSASQNVLIDPKKISRAITNILNNAIEAAKGGKIWIKTHKTNGYITIELGNTTSHIEKENLSKIFNSFWTQKKKDGRGLGLAIAKKFIEEHGGEISCESDGHCSARGQVDKVLEEHYVVFRINIPI